MNTSRKSFLLPFTIFCALGVTASRPAAAQSLTTTNTLTGVVFSDGAAASGVFNTNFFSSPPSYSPFDITTQNGLTDTVKGSHYVSGVGSVDFVPPAAFIFNTSGTTGTELFLAIGNEVSPDIFALEPGTLHYNSATGAVDGFSGSVETGPGFYRTLLSGTLVLTPAPAPVPEASTTISFGLLLALGLSGVVVAAKRKKASA